MADQEKQLQSRSNKNESECCSGGAAIMKELKALNTRLDRMQIDFENQVNSRSDSMEMQVNSRVDKLCGSMEKLTAENKDAVLKEIEKATKDMRANLDTEVGILCARMEKMEKKISDTEARKKSFDPETSVIVVGLPESEVEDLMSKVRDLLHDGLGCDTVVCPVAVERMSARGNRPGLVKVELSSVQVKIAVLRRKSKLKDNERFNKVYVSSAKSHAERLLELNFRSLIRETAVGKDFYLTGNGRLMKRTQSSRTVAREAGLGGD
ncbi:PREDICTED: uncharacterized protein LOC106519492 [Xyrichtys novacula]|uniref:PREDICTED: uncharacterized protein LOC106519492 n=1 Tax=Xyrichtys novacula TaxID=13765 RepID=A0AAV1G008_XYRNO|nr:PREDICTED: uncharacterized protein LOC106519492 [Xyrichtys novacula]